MRKMPDSDGNTLFHSVCLTLLEIYVTLLEDYHAVFMAIYIIFRYYVVSFLYCTDYCIPVGKC